MNYCGRCEIYTSNLRIIHGVPFPRLQWKLKPNLVTVKVVEALDLGNCFVCSDTEEPVA